MKRHYFQYSDAQIAEIETVLSHLAVSTGAVKGLHRSLSICINAHYVDGLPLREARRSIVKDSVDTIAAIERLCELNGFRIREGDELEGQYERDPIGVALEKALPHLKEIYWLSMRKIDYQAWFAQPKESK